MGVEMTACSRPVYLVLYTIIWLTSTMYSKAWYQKELLAQVVLVYFLLNVIQII